MTKEQAQEIADKLAVETNDLLNIVEPWDSLDGDATAYLAKQYLKALNKLNGNA